MAKQLGRDRDPFRESFDRFRTRVDHAVAADAPAIRFAALVLVRNMKLQLSHPGTGRLYGGAISRVSGKARHTHRASAPGEPPAPDTGTLRNSIGSGIVGGVMRVGTGLNYGAYLEFGTLGDGGFIAPRPWARPALAASRKEMGQVAVGELRSTVQGL